MVRTFLDSGVLLAATRSLGHDRERALQILEDANRTFLTSPFVHLELVPKAIFHKKRLEKAFYDEYFDGAEWFRDLDKIEAAAQTEAAKSGLPPWTPSMWRRRTCRELTNSSPPSDLASRCTARL